MTIIGKNKRLRRVLVANDDGIRARGLSVSEKVLATLADEIWVVAPSNENSGASRSFTLNHPLCIHQHGSRRFSVDGTPADCVMLALKEIMADSPPDLVISGINFGSNLGEEVGYSGTVSAAFEATIAGVPAIAMSQLYHRPTRKAPWEIAETHAAHVIKSLVGFDWPPSVMMNVNFPALDDSKPRGIKVTHLDHGNVAHGHYTRDPAVRPNSAPFRWKGFSPSFESDDRQSDVGAVQDGYIAVTPLNLDFTDRHVLQDMHEHEEFAI